MRVLTLVLDVLEVESSFLDLHSKYLRTSFLSAVSVELMYLSKYDHGGGVWVDSSLSVLSTTGSLSLLSIKDPQDCVSVFPHPPAVGIGSRICK